MAEEKKLVQFQIRGEDPIDAITPIYSNFVGISRVGTDIQFEFIFLDLNQLAQILDPTKAKGPATATGPQELVGKTVAKIVMPGLNFMQAKEQIDVIMRALSEAFQAPEVRK
jgi:hypothetical protein